MALNMHLIRAMYARDVAKMNASTQAGDLEGDGDASLRLAMLRVAASRLCPSPKDLLVGATVTALRGILPPEECSASDVDGDVDALIASGDLFVGEALVTDRRRALLFLSPPMYVRRSGGAVFVVGGLPETPAPFQSITRSRGPIRELVPPPSDQDLADEGFTAFPMDAWIASPSPTSDSGLVGELDDRLSSVGNAGELLDLEILSPDADPGFYRGRWAAPRRATGRFISRRKRKWGGRAWGYAELVNGEAVKFCTLPVLDRRFRGCDEAWWAIFALDAMKGSRQPLEIQPLGETTRVALRLPLPMWAERRLLAIGTIADARPHRALFAYDLPSAEADEEIAFLAERLWMEPHQPNRGSI